MLSNTQIEKLMKPIIDRQKDINLYVITLIAKRVKEIGELLPSDLHRLERIYKMGADIRKINQYIAKLTGLNEKAIKQLIKTVAEFHYKDAKPFYDYRQKPYIEFKNNEALQQIVTAIANQTSQTYVNLSRAQAFMLRDPTNPKILIPTSLSKTYNSIIDEAVQASQSGVIDYGTAMRRSLQQLAESGIRTVEYQAESGKFHTQSLEAAVKRNVLNGIRAISQEVQDEIGRQFGADGKEITVHEMSAPDHEPIQGHQFTNEEYEKLQNGEDFQDVKGHSFKAIKRPIGVYNCRHFTYSIIVGISKPTYTEEQLKANIERNHKGYTDKNGKHMTLYECTQKQRTLERSIRDAKELVLTGKAAGNNDLTRRGEALLSQRQKAYSAFSKACGLKKKPLNTTVQGFKW